jgi:hypothetical protein
MRRRATTFAKPGVGGHGILEPGNTVKTYTITKLGSAMSVDGIGFMRRRPTGITTPRPSNPPTSIPPTTL